MVGVAEPKRFFLQSAEQRDLHKIKQRNSQHQQWRQHGEAMGMPLVVKMRQDGHHGEEITDEMAAGVAEKRARVGEIPWQKSGERATHEKSGDGDEVFA